MKKVYAPYFALIRESISAIESYRPADMKTFLASPVLQDAVLMRMQVIGESLIQMRALDDDAFEQRAAESWNQVIGLRNIISHGYRTIDFERIWQIITDELPPFSATIAAAEEQFSQTRVAQAAHQQYSFNICR